eukprot:7254664-Karenia_brevis.AAC.1
MPFLNCVKSAILTTSSKSSAELSLAGPITEQPEIWDIPEWKSYWDDVNGGFLDAQRTRKARKLEIKWINDEGV